MIAIVTGGRDFLDAQFVIDTMDRFHAAVPISVLVHGDADGLDKMVGAWAEANGIETKAEPIPPEQWQRLGGRAGNARNALMLRKYEPEVLLAFVGHSGTLDMVKRARSQGIKTFMTWNPSWVDQLEQYREERTETLSS